MRELRQKVATLVLVSSLLLGMVVPAVASADAKLGLSGNLNSSTKLGLNGNLNPSIKRNIKATDGLIDFMTGFEFVVIKVNGKDKARLSGIGLRAGMFNQDVTLPTKVGTIDGNGVMYDVVEVGDVAFSPTNHNFPAHTDFFRNLVIPAGITKIGYGGFLDAAIDSLQLPKGIALGELSFAMNDLKHLEIPEGVTEIPGMAFAVNSLTSVSLPEGLEKIKVAAFTENVQLRKENINIPNSLKVVEGSTFKFTGILDLDFGDDVKVGEDVFAGSALTVPLPTKKVVHYVDNAGNKIANDAITILNNPEVLIKNDEQRGLTQTAEPNSVTLAGVPNPTIKGYKLVDSPKEATSPTALDALALYKGERGDVNVIVRYEKIAEPTKPTAPAKPQAKPKAKVKHKMQVKSVKRLAVGKKTKLKVSHNGSKGLTKNHKQVTYKSSNKRILTVDKKGQVHAKRKGTAVITVKSKADGLQRKVKIKVYQPITKLKIKVNHPKKYPGSRHKTIEYKVVVNKSATSKKVTWKSSNKKIATVNQKGKVVGKRAGWVTISAKAKDGSKKTAKIRVYMLPKK